MTLMVSMWKGLIEVPNKSRTPSSRDILSDVAWRHDMKVSELISPSRQPRYVRARWEAMHLLRNTPKIGGLQRSLCEVARILGGLDHTTVLHGLRRYAETVSAESAKREAEAA